MSETRKYAVVDRTGYYRNTTQIYGSYSTEADARHAAKTRTGCRMIIRHDGPRGTVVYGDTIGKIYPVVG